MLVLTGLATEKNLKTAAEHVAYLRFKEAYALIKSFLVGLTLQDFESNHYRESFDNGTSNYDAVKATAYFSGWLIKIGQQTQSSGYQLPEVAPIYESLIDEFFAAMYALSDRASKGLEEKFAATFRAAYPYAPETMRLVAQRVGGLFLISSSEVSAIILMSKPEFESLKGQAIAEAKSKVEGSSTQMTALQISQIQDAATQFEALIALLDNGARTAAQSAGHGDVLQSKIQEMQTEYDGNQDGMLKILLGYFWKSQPGQFILANY